MTRYEKKEIQRLAKCEVEVGRIMRRGKTGNTPKGKAEPDGEESGRLLVAWNKLSGVRFIDNEIDRAVRGMARALTALYQTWHDSEALKISQAARAFRNALCPDSQTHKKEKKQKREKEREKDTREKKRSRTIVKKEETEPPTCTEQNPCGPSCQIPTLLCRDKALWEAGPC